MQGEPTLVTEIEEIALCPGMCAGFPAQGVAHQLVNRTGQDVLYLEIGDRSSGDEGSYPNDDLQAALGPDGKWQFTHKKRRALSMTHMPRPALFSIIAHNERIVSEVLKTGSSEGIRVSISDKIVELSARLLASIAPMYR